MIPIGSSVVANVIVADPAIDPAPPGYSLAWVSDWIDIGDPFDAPAPVIATVSTSAAPTSPSSGITLL
jgi:hypothetical protein